MAISTTHETRELVWSRPEPGRPEFVLRAGGEEIGWVKFEEGVGSRSAAAFQGRRWTFERTGAVHPSVTIRAQEGPDPVAHFVPHLAGGGVVSFASGARYCWNRAHIWSASWCFRREGERSAVCLSQHAGPLMGGARVNICCERAAAPETPLLILLACYLRVLTFERLAESISVCG
ncbi:MAG: hypothetical protein M1436_08800 [Acidobacteria bacterium]|nr:hypothetical protein [Acidobacteriota bacterium]